MKNLFSVFLILGLFLANNLHADDFSFEEVEEMVKQDDTLRLRFIYEKDFAVKNEIAKQIRLQEVANTEKIKKIILDFGLPIDNDDISHICKLIIRSSDLDFQTKILSQIITLDDESWLEWIPNLTDRILLRQGFPQRYGTHLHIQDGSYAPYPTENIENVDELRKKFFQLPLEIYIHKMRQIFMASLNQDKSHQQKVIFNQRYNFYGNPDDYLYVISPEDECAMPTASSIIAFDHPAHAAIYVFRYQWDCDYEIIEGGETDDVREADYSIEDKNTDDVWSFGGCDHYFEPCYMFLLPREKYQSVDFKDKILMKIFIASEKIEPVETFECESILDPLSTLDKKIRIECSSSYLSKLRIRDIYSSNLCSLLFDSTLENESF